MPIFKFPLLNYTMEGRKVIVTGGAGFIGSHLVEKLVNLGASVTVIDNLSRGKLSNLANVASKINFIKADLTNLDAQKYFENGEIVFHLASPVGSVKLMSTKQLISSLIPLIDRNVFEACRKYDVEKIVYASTACVYPTFLQTKEFENYFLREEDALLLGAKPEGLYGWGKLYGELLGGRYHEEYGIGVGIARLFNVYGPREDFSPEMSHVIPSLIRKAINRENPFVVWGSGEQSRSFIFVEDAVEGMIVISRKVSNAMPVNVGTQERTKIKDLARKILELVGYEATPVFDVSQPTGVYTRCPDLSRANKLGWKPKVNLEEGLKITIEWYKNFVKKKQV